MPSYHVGVSYPCTHNISPGARAQMGGACTAARSFWSSRRNSRAAAGVHSQTERRQCPPPQLLYLGNRVPGRARRRGFSYLAEVVAVAGCSHRPLGLGWAGELPRVTGGLCGVSFLFHETIPNTERTASWLD